MKATKFTMLAILATSAVTANAGVIGGMKDGMGQMWNTAGNPGAISVEAGSLGYGANIAYGANEYTEVQVGWTGGDILSKAEFEVKDVDFEAETDFSTPYVGVQLRPLKNWLTVGVGAMYMGKNEIIATATPAKGKSFTYNGKTYTAEADAKIDSSLEFKNAMSPYLSLGFRPNINNRFGLFGELGVAYTGGMEANVDAHGSFKVDGRTFDDTHSQYKAEIQKLEDDARTEIEDEIKDYDDYYPVVKIGATMRF